LVDRRGSRFINSIVRKHVSLYGNFADGSAKRG